ncbi:amino acid adenylation domain-containing protein [Rhodoferax sp.]|uniref:non-ribosomal peptide synthetase n=1 Tax=Rhodoferax sp. TaxID=50421 RepID=UPI00374D806A
MDAVSPGAFPPEELPLSLSQHEVWLDQRAWAGSAHLNIGGSCFFQGPLDLPRFKQSLALLVAESEALRLAPLIDGRQQLLAQGEVQLELVDMSTELHPKAAMRAWWQERMAVPFALDGTPPWRFALLRAHDSLHGLMIQFHHLVMDGWGTTQVGRRWSEIYNALEAGQAPAVQAVPGYRQFIEESHSYRQSPAFERDAAYWQAQMPLLPPALIERRYATDLQQELPAARLGLQRIARADYDRLRQVAAERGSSAFNFFLAALVLYFGRVSNRQEVVVGVPSLNRAGRRFNDTLGMFVGVMPVVVPLTPEMTVGELLVAVGSAMRGALRHPRYPLSDLGRTLEMARNRRDGLFDLLLSFERQDYPVSFGAAELVESRQLFSGKARFPLGVTVCEFHAQQDVELALEASAACFAHGEVELLGRRLWHVVEACMGAADTHVYSIPLLPPEEHWALIDGLHKDVAAMAVPQPFISLFDHQARLRPESNALVWDGGEMDYATLDRVSSHLAARLLQLGAGKDKIVAVLMERCADMVVAVLAVAKAGAAFLPLDPEAPMARLQAILEEAGAMAVLVQPRGDARLARLHPQTLQVDWLQAQAETLLQGVPRLSVQPVANDLAYVLFTSGSTGRPKGVMIEHGTLARRLGWLSRAYAVEWHDRSAQATQLTFDPSLIELLLPLVHGASVALPSPGRLLPESLADFAVKFGVTIMAFVPSTLSRFLDAAGHRRELKLRVACCGGEVLSPELASRFLKETGGRLYNVYGPTETAIFATAWECESHRTDSALPIGRPIDDTRIYVLDAALQPMPMGVPGEIFIGGDAIARGYLNRPELDAQVFLPDPYRPGSRMYRTGDRGWLGGDGNLHFLGRLDRQIKLRGYRIELGEIESALSAIEGVLQAAAKLVERKGKPMIQAWVAAAGKPSAESLQAVLRMRLPDYMVPSGISVLASLPTSAVGKIDYEALPDPGLAAAARSLRAADRKFEPELLAIWQQVLDTRPLGVHDNFFDLGGDSLAAVTMLVDIEKLVGRRVPMYLITEYPTIESLAQALAAQTKGPSVMLNLGADTGRVPLYLAASGHGDLLRFQNLARALGNACDVHMLQPPMTEPIHSINHLAELYAECIQSHGKRPGFLAGFSVGGVAALETARLLRQRGVPLRGLFLIDTAYPASRLGGTAFWRLCSWLVRRLRVQDLNLNGRRMGAMFNDPGLVSQVMALKAYRPAGFDGPTLLVKSSGLASWSRWLFKPWRRLMPKHLYEQQIPGLHGSIFEPGNVNDLARVIADRMDIAP